MANIIDTSNWHLEDHQISRFLHVGENKLPVYVRPFKAPQSDYSMLYPAGRLDGLLWKLYIGACRSNSLFDPSRRAWIWSKLAVEKATSDGSRPAPPILTKEQKLALKAEREKEKQDFEKNLAELSKLENVPESDWPSYSYPSHYKPCDPLPTALQRIVVSRYWDKSSTLVGASVGSGKSRMVIDMLNARALSPLKTLNDSARIILLIAPLSLHENWIREFAKWKSGEAEWHVHKFSPTKEFWKAAERSATKMFDGKSGPRTGGVVIIATPNILARGTLTDHLTRFGWVPTFVVSDEIHKFFRNPQNNAYKRLMPIRRSAWGMIGLSGTPTAKLQDWHALEELVLGTPVDAHWRGATFEDYRKLGDPLDFWASPLFEKGWSFDRGIQTFHAWRIGKGRAMLADKNYYMADALPGLEQEELGEFADLRLSFGELFELYPDEIDKAVRLQREQSGESQKLSPALLASTILLRLQQLAASSDDSKKLLGQFVTDFLEPDEPCIVWVHFRNEPCLELQETVKFLMDYGRTTFLMGQMTERERWLAVDSFQRGDHRFFVIQDDAGGVGLNLTRACKSFFHTIPFSYLGVTQCIGRQHRIGQTDDCVAYFNCSHPIAAFARGIYDRRVTLNEVIPASFGDLLAKYKL